MRVLLLSEKAPEKVRSQKVDRLLEALEGSFSRPSKALAYIVQICILQTLLRGKSPYLAMEMNAMKLSVRSLPSGPIYLSGNLRGCPTSRQFLLWETSHSMPLWVKRK